MKQINLELNQFSGTIPICLTNPAYLAVNIANNKFIGTIPSHWHSPYLDVSGNKLSGTIPKDLYIVDQYSDLISYVSGHGFNISLYNNKFDGTLSVDTFAGMCEFFQYN